MKKLFILSLIAIAAICAVGCKQEPQGGNAQLVNPMKQVESVEDFKALGLDVKLPENATDVVLYIYNDTFAEIIFNVDGNEFTLRVQKNSDIETLSGIYGEWVSSNRLSEAEYYQVGENAVSGWTKDDVTYVISTAADEEALAAVTEAYLNN